MNPSHPRPSAPPATSTDREERLRLLPTEARAAFARFQDSGDVQALDPVLLAILNDFLPQTSAQPLAEQKGDTRLVEDLGFDSLALTEVVFFAEDLFGITITNEEMLHVHTLDDLRGFIARKVSARAPR